jgi:hypothetical protein
MAMVEARTGPRQQGNPQQRSTPQTRQFEAAVRERPGNRCNARRWKEPAHEKCLSKQGVLRVNELNCSRFPAHRTTPRDDINTGKCKPPPKLAAAPENYFGSRCPRGAGHRLLWPAHAAKRRCAATILSMRRSMRRRSFLLAVTRPLSARSIPAALVADKILGRLLGNLDGLPHEMKYILEPGDLQQYTPPSPTAPCRHRILHQRHGKDLRRRRFRRRPEKRHAPNHLRRAPVLSSEPARLAIFFRIPHPRPRALSLITDPHVTRHQPNRFCSIGVHRRSSAAISSLP